MSETTFINKIKPESGNTIEIEADIVVDNITVRNPDSASSSVIPLPVGSITQYAGRTSPDGFLICDGRALSRVTHSRLFAVIGEDWGAGDGSTTFNIPDLRGSFLRGVGIHGSEEKANGNKFEGPALGAFDNDQFQNFDRYNGMHGDEVRAGQMAVYGKTANDIPGGASPAVSFATTTAGSTFYQMITSEPKDDGTNGVPRDGDETKPFSAGVNYIIRV